MPVSSCLLLVFPRLPGAIRDDTPKKGKATSRKSLLVEIETEKRCQAGSGELGLDELETGLTRTEIRGTGRDLKRGETRDNTNGLATE